MLEDAMLDADALPEDMLDAAGLLEDMLDGGALLADMLDAGALLEDMLDVGGLVDGDEPDDELLEHDAEPRATAAIAATAKVRLIMVGLVMVRILSVGGA